MFDRFNRQITYLRISVTDRCNLRCRYCVPEIDCTKKSHKKLLTFDQIVAFTKRAAHLGITKVRLTGGEPLLRRGIERLIGRLANIEGLSELCLTTNGTRLANIAKQLKENGLRRVNISLDSIEASKYRFLTGGGNLDDVLQGIAAAHVHGLNPIKINMVVSNETTYEEVEAMSSFCTKNNLALQLISQFSLRAGKHSPLSIGKGFRHPTQRPPNCATCNRLRLTSDGYIKPCLFSELEIPVNFNDISSSLIEAVTAKPQSGNVCLHRHMYEIGG